MTRLSWCTQDPWNRKEECAAILSGLVAVVVVVYLFCSITGFQGPALNISPTAAAASISTMAASAAHFIGKSAYFNYTGCTIRPFATDKPFLFGVGTQKSGTSSLWAVLSTWTDFDDGHIKEHHFFDNYQGESVTQEDLDAYLANFDKASSRFKLDISPSYMTVRNTARRICECMTNTKVLILLRDPTHRAFSSYYERHKHSKYYSNFSGMLEQQLASFHDNELEKYSQVISKQELERGLYVNQLKEIAKYFHSENVFVYQSEMLFADEGLFFAKLTAFLGVANNFTRFPHERSRSPKPTAHDLQVFDQLDQFYCPYNQQLFTALAAYPPNVTFFDPHLWDNKRCSCTGQN